MVPQEEPLPEESELSEPLPKKSIDRSQGIKEGKVAEDRKEIELTGTYRNENLTITIGEELWPTDESVIITSTDSSGYISPEFLNGKILEKIDIDPTSVTFDEKQIHLLHENGYTRLNLNNRKIFFVLTLDLSNNEGALTSKIQNNLINLFNELVNNQEASSNTMYLPLIGTGSAGVPILTSFSAISTTLESFLTTSDQEIKMTLSVPPEIQSEDKAVIKDYFDQWEYVSSIGHQDKIDFHLDDPTLEDKLGRRPIAKSLARLINDDIFSQERKSNYAFMAHLQGRWGEGKSSFMKFLEDELQKTGKHNWIVINYNAWQHQYVDPPWWTFLDALYKQAKEQIKIKGGKWSEFIYRESIRRLNKSTLLALIILLIFTGLILLFTYSLSDGTEDIKAIISFLTLVGTLFGIAQAWSRFFILDTPENAKLFMERAENPAKKIKNRFEELVSNIEKSHPDKKIKFKVAFFIDDLDRCENTFVVKLLEGIQTMFRNRNVFYLVAADKHWIAQSFELEYSDYEKTAKEGTRLGYSFIEKNFQLSLRLPYSTPNQIKKYWDYILKREEDAKQKQSENTETLKRKIQSMQQKEILSGNADVNKLSDEFSVPVEEAQEAVLEAVNQSSQDIEHLFQDFHELIGNNPRAVKRLANQYTVYRDLIMVERNKVDPLRLFRWVVLQNRWPILVDGIQRDPSKIDNVDKYLEEWNLSSYKDDINFVLGSNDERLVQEDIETFLGLQ